MEHAVVVVGGGPTGMMLAGELALAGVDVAVVERRRGQELESARARGFHARTIEVLDQRGIAERFLEAGETLQIGGFAMIPLDLSDCPTRHPYGLALGQAEMERLLAAWLTELDVTTYRETTVTGVAQDDDGVTVHTAGELELRARYVVGCDGGRSVVRKATGIDFVGWAASTAYLHAEVTMRETPPFGVRRDDHGIYALGPLPDGRVGVVVREPHVDEAADPALADLSAALAGVYGTDFGLQDATWISRFTDAARQAAAYRDRRVLLAGDAAHVHSPTGGQGVNTGIQDAVNLGWKLARVVDGTAPDALLDTYHAERHPVAARVLKGTLAQTAMSRGDDRTEALREVLTDVFGMDEPRRRYAAMMSGLDVHYDLGDGHPLLGRRMPDLDVRTADGPTRVAELLRAARPVLLDLALDLTPRHDGVTHVRAEHDGGWELPVLGEVTAPDAVLIRPDGYVAWAGTGSDAGLADALTTWCGASSTSADRIS